MVVGGLLVAVAIAAAPALAQAPPQPRAGVSAAPGDSTSVAPGARGPKPGQVETDPIRCWWKADRTAVRVGERFGLTLTCGVIETGPVTVVAAVNQLEGGALALTPFDVVSSGRREDVVSPPWRYFQFEYVVRMLNDGFFGQDVNIPALTVTYNLKVEGAESEGRDQSYILPALPMKVMSVVPRAAADIRDASDQTFALSESRRFRASADMVASGVLYAFAAVLAGLAVVAGTARFRTRAVGAVRPVPTSSVLAGGLKMLDEVKAQAAGGWTPELARRAQSALRLGGAVALGRPVSQIFVPREEREHDGQVAVTIGLLRPRRALVSASTTAASISAANISAASAAQLANGHRPAPKQRATLEQLGESLSAFNASAYGRVAEVDSIALNAALSEGTEAVRRLRSTTMWPARLFN
jgi:hypothetical protein